MSAEVDIYRKVLPLIGISSPTHPRETAVLGTAFVVTDGVLVTCWHVVAPAIDKGWTIIGAWDERGDGRFARVDITDIAQHPAGDDLAMARIDLPGAGWRLPSRQRVIEIGTDVAALGYPLPDKRVDPDGGFTHLVSFRLLKGYVTHMPVIQERGYPPTASLELDMPAPAGLSGGPLLSLVETNVLLGVVYGTHGVDRIESFSSVDPNTGERTPEVVQTVTFALAHHPVGLWSLKGPATEGMTLGQLMLERGEVLSQ